MLLVTCHFVVMELCMQEFRIRIVPHTALFAEPARLDRNSVFRSFTYLTIAFPETQNATHLFILMGRRETCGKALALV
jgi:hypothetical protein